MSEDQAPSAVPPVAPTADWLLVSLIQVINKMEGAGLSITLHVGGFLVSGQLASGADYLKETGASLDAAISGTGKLTKTFEEVAKKFYDGESRGIGYVHIRNARFFHPGSDPIPQNSQSWWRGRVSEVSGFVIGEMKTD